MRRALGEYMFHIESKGARDIRAFNGDEGGGEVVFRKGTHLHVTKVNPETKEVWAEEV